MPKLAAGERRGEGPDTEGARVEAVGEDAMSSPKDGGAAQRRSRLEAVAGAASAAASANAEAGSVRHPDTLKRITRYVAFAAYAGAFLAIVVQVGLRADGATATAKGCPPSPWIAPTPCGAKV